MAELQTDLHALNRKIVEDNIIIICTINIFVVCGFFGNILSVYFFGFKERKNSNDTLIAALTACNAFANVLAAAEQKKNTNYLTFTDETGCKVHYFLTFSIIKLVALILTLIALNRNRWLCHPFSWQLTPKKITLSILASVLYSVSSSIVQFMIAHVEQINIKTDQEHGHSFENLDQDNVTTDIISANVSSTKWINTTSEGNKTSVSSMNAGVIDTTTEANETFPQNKLFPASITSESNKNLSKYMTSIVAHVCTNMGTANDSNKKLFQISNLVDIIVTTCILILIVYWYGAVAKFIFDHWKIRTELQEEQRNTDSFKKKDLKFRTDTKITLMAVTFTVLTGLTVTPYFVVKFLQTPDLVDGDQITLRLISSSYMLNSAIDPYVIAAFIPNFRKFVKQLVCCLFYRKRNIRSKTGSCQQEEHE